MGVENDEAGLVMRRSGRDTQDVVPRERCVAVDGTFTGSRQVDCAYQCSAPVDTGGRPVAGQRHVLLAIAPKQVIAELPGYLSSHRNREPHAIDSPAMVRTWASQA
jgi:hypothetical protein